MDNKKDFLLILDIYGNRHVKVFPDDLDEIVIGEDSSHYSSLYRLNKNMDVLEDLNEKLSEYFIENYSDNCLIFENPPPFVTLSDAYKYF